VTAVSTAAPAPRSAVTQSVRDSLVVARRNLIRMLRIPDLVRSCWSGLISPRIRDRRSNVWKEQVK
jgi:hypothetical protein